MKVGFNKNEFCDASLIMVPADSIGLNRGYAAFDFMKVVNRKPFYTERHIDRFFRTMSVLRIEIPYSREELQNIINSLTEKNEDSNYGLKFFAVPIDINDSDTYKCDIYIVPVDLPVYQPDMFTEGSSLITKEYLRFLPEAKSTNYLPTIFWENELKKHNALEILYCFNGQVLETSKSNIFIVRDNHVYTQGNNVLKGITRSIVIDLLGENRIPFSEKEILTDELFAADEVFITSTTKGIAPIINIDGKTINDGVIGTISKKLLKAYSAMLT